jgi:hypothetical protein
MISTLTNLFRSGLIASALFAVASPSLRALTLTPSSTAVARGNETSEAAILAVMAPYLGSATQLYKATRADGSETGVYAGSYATDFTNPAPLVPSSALITYSSGSPIRSDPVYAFIRDGSYTNYNWYLFDVSGWNGVDPIAFTGFFPLPNGGSQNISHIGIFGTGRPSVPDSGATVTLLAAAVIGLAVLARRYRF